MKRRFRARLRRHKVALTLIALALLGSAWVALGVFQVMGARRQASAAESAAREAAEMVGSGDLEGARAQLHEALDSLNSARNALRSPWVSPARLVPYLGTEVRAAEAGVVAVRSTSLATLNLLDYVVADRAPIYREGRFEPDGLAALRVVLAESLGYVADARGTLTAAPHPRLGFVAERFDEADRVTESLFEVLQGILPLVDRLATAATGEAPYRVLLLLENGAERRATGGITGFIALFEIDQAGVRLADLGSVVGRLQARDDQGRLVTVPAPVDYLRRYGEFMANTTLWSNIAMSPDFPTVAEVARRLYQAATQVEADAVARLDLVGLGYLLDAFPTVTIDGQPVDGSALATDFLIDSYRRFPDDTHPGEQSAYVAGAMQQVFGQLVGGAPADRSAVLSAIRRAVGERRLSVVTGDGEVDAMLAQAGADGGVLPGGPGDLMVNAQNFASNKIDLFTETNLAVDVTIDKCRVQGEATLTLVNATPAGLEFLPHWRIGNAGRWMVSVYPPRGAAILGLEVNGRAAGGAYLEEFGRTVVSVIVDADLGASATVKLRWQEDLTRPGYTLSILAQPTVVPATVAVSRAIPVPFVETVRREFREACGG